MKHLMMLVLLFVSTGAFAQDRLGVGAMLGNPTGVNLKYWLGEDTAVDGGAGFSFGKHTDFNLHSDYLFHNKAALYLNEVNPLDVYFGIGARMEFSDDIELGVRVPVGVAHSFDHGKADTFIEVAPVLDFLTVTGVELGVALGGRFYIDL